MKEGLGALPRNEIVWLERGGNQVAVSVKLECLFVVPDDLRLVGENEKLWMRLDILLVIRFAKYPRRFIHLVTSILLETIIDCVGSFPL